MHKLIRTLLAPTYYLAKFLYAVFPVMPVINRMSDEILKKTFLAINESGKKEDNREKKLLLITGYYFGKAHMLIDSLLYIALSSKGYRVIPVITGSFFKDECPYFGGVYGQWRTIRLATVAKLENKLWTKVFGCNPVYISSYLSKADIQRIQSMHIPNMSLSELRALNTSNFEVFRNASVVHSNMTDSPRINLTTDDLAESTLQSIRNHSLNIVRYILAIENLLNEIDPKVIVSNVGLYYKWSVPSQLGRLRGIPVYNYMLSEKPNSFTMALNTSKLLEVEDLEGSIKLFRANHKMQNFEQLDGLKKSWLDFYSSPRRTHYSEVYGLKSTYQSNDKELMSIQKSNEEMKILIPLNHPSDATVLQGPRIFEDYVDFLEGMITIAKKFENYQFVFKAHPAESIHDHKVEFKSSLDYLEELGVSKLSNCKILDARTRISVEEILKQTDTVICYSSSVGITAGILGIRVIQCGVSYTLNSSLFECPKEFEELLASLQIKKDLDSDLLVSKNERVLNILAFSLLHYLNFQIDTGLFETSDLTNKGSLKPGVTIDSILKNKYLEFIADKISAVESFASESGLPPASGELDVIDASLVKL
jgi:hypothetical protein